jgi:hypothetical protein
VEVDDFCGGGSALTVNDIDAITDGGAEDGGGVMGLAGIEGDFGGVGGPPVFGYIKAHGDGLGEISPGVYLESFREGEEESRKNHLRMNRLGGYSPLLLGSAGSVLLTGFIGTRSGKEAHVHSRVVSGWRRRERGPDKCC